MVPRGEFWDYASIVPVHSDLGVQTLSQYALEGWFTLFPGPGVV
jgi:hypothetical protein